MKKKFIILVAIVLIIEVVLIMSFIKKQNEMNKRIDDLCTLEVVECEE